MIRLAVILFSFFIFIESAIAYTPPIGIPNPNWMVHPIDTVTPSRPVDWSSPVAGYYYVDDATGSDSGNTYGTPSAPRLTIPNPIPAGGYVELHGTYNQTSGGSTRFASSGIAASPSWIVGLAGQEPTILSQVTVEGSYLYVDGITFSGKLSSRTTVSSDHIAIRNSVIDYAGTDSTSQVGITGGVGFESAYWVVYNCTFHDSVVPWNDGEVDVDVHAIKPGNYVNNVWILNNTFYNIGGNAIQVGDQTSNQSNVTNIYIGYNDAYNTRQSVFGIKKARDVIISGNTLHGSHEIQTGNSCAGVAWQYAPGYLWIINNEMYDLDHGIKSGADTSPAEDHVFIIGNVIHDIEYFGDHTGGGWYQGGAFRINGSSHVYIINNISYDTEDGITTDMQSDKYIYFENNIISNITNGDPRNHIYIQYGTLNMTVRNNILYQPDGTEKITDGDISEVSLVNYAEDSNCLATDPLLTNADGNDFTLQVASPAIGNALNDENLTVNVYSTFVSRYGLSISVDRIGTSRPQNTTWDIGAYEYAVPDTTDPVPSALSPSGAQSCSSNPRTVTLSLTCTDTVGCTACKADTSDVDIDSMSITLAQDGTTWSGSTGNLACDASYTYYVKCEDAADNESAASEWNFSISAAVAAAIGGAGLNATQGPIGGAGLSGTPMGGMGR